MCEYVNFVVLTGNDNVCMLISFPLITKCCLHNFSFHCQVSIFKEN